jgi:hypothetical protein
MTAVSDAVVIGVVLGLVFAAVSYYLFSRISQLERKVSFMETILLELKVTTEQTLLSATEPPSAVAGPSADDLNSYNDVVEQATRKVATEQAVPEDSATIKTIRTYTSVDETEQVTQPMGTDIRELLVEPSPPRARGSQETVQVERERERESSKHSVGVNFEAMTYKELQQYARDKGISGIRNLSKKEVIEIFRRRENTSNASSSATSVGSTPDVSDLSSWKQSSAQESAFQPLQDTEELGGMVGANEGFAPLADKEQPVDLESMD